MAINLLGYVAPQSATALVNSSGQKSQTTTPSATSYLPGSSVGTSNQMVTPMGVNAVSPYSNQSAPSGALPTAQVAKTTQTAMPTQPAAGQAGTPGSAGNQYSLVNGQWVLGGGGTPQVSSAAPVQTNVSDPITTIPAASLANASATPLVTASTATPTTSSATQPYSTTNPVTQPGLLAQAANLASQPSADYTAQEAQANAYNQQLQQSYSDEAQALANIEGSPRGLNFAQGAENVIRNQALLNQQGLATAYQGAAGLMGAANTQQSQEQTGLLSAAGQTAPVTQFGQLTNPQTGAVISPTGGNPQLNTAVAQAVQLVQNGASTQDAITASGLSNFGLPGSQALTAALQGASGGSYNPTAQNATAQTNATTGTTLGATAATLQPSLTGLTQVGQQLQSLLTSANGLNALGTNWQNTEIQNFQSTFGNNANVSSLNAIVNDANSYIAQILQSSDGLTPTAATAASNSLNLATLTPSALATVIQNISNLGQIRLGTLQQGATGALGATSGSLYQGSTAAVSPTASVNSDTGAVQTSNPATQAAGGLLTSALQGGASLISGIIKNVSGIVGGAAAEILGL